MTEQSRPRFRATRTTPDPYPPHPVLVFTDKSEEEVRRSQSVAIKDCANAFWENAYGNELSDFIDLSEPRFTATLEPSGEEVFIWGWFTEEELATIEPTVCVEIGHRSGAGPKELVPRGQLTGVAVLDQHFTVEDIVAAPIAGDLVEGPPIEREMEAEAEAAGIGARVVRSARRRFGRSGR